MQEFYALLRSSHYAESRYRLSSDGLRPIKSPTAQNSSTVRR